MSQRKQHAFLILRYVVIVFAFASLLLFFYQCIRNINKFAEIDLTSYIRASTWFFEGENPYQEISRRFIYPLFLLLIVYPFQTLVSSPGLKAVTAAIWSLASYLAFFFSLAACWRYLYQYRTLWEAVRRNILAISLIVVIFHPSLQDEFLNGQVNLLVMGATAAFFIFVEKGKLFWAALFLAAATSVKIAPGLCLLYILISRQYRVALYFIPLVILFVLGFPYLINDQSLAYYRYFVSDVMPNITGSDFKGGFRSFSVISTLSYVFKIHWYPPLKILIVGLLAIALSTPIIRHARSQFEVMSNSSKFVVFGAIVSVLPLTFPMSEAHHLLLQIIPVIAIVAYWKTVVESGRSLFRDRLSIIFLLSSIGLHVGHGLKDTPIRLLSLIGIYAGMILLMKKQGSRVTH